MKKLRQGTHSAFGVSIAFALSLSALFFYASNLPAQQTIEIGGKTYIQKQEKWFVESEGKLYEVNSRVITVKFKKGITADAKRSFYTQQRLTVIRSNPLGYVDLELPAGADPLGYIQKLQKEDIIESTEVNTIGEYVPIMTPDDPIFSNQWHLPKTNVAPNPTASAWDITTGSEDIIIAVLDSGTDIGHEDLIGNIWINPREDIDNDRAIIPSNADHLDSDDTNAVDDDSNGFVDDLAGWDFANNNNNVRGPFYHGTHVAGILGAMSANGIGVASVAGGWSSEKGSLIMALGVGDSAPDSSALDDAIIYAADNGARVITMSLSIASNAAVDAALDYAYNRKGVFIDNAAGNSGGPVSYPATNANVVAVSATDQTDVISSFSNRGPEVELAAPGREIWSTRLNSTYGQGNGTSYASPQIAGTAGLLLSCNPSFTNNQVRTILQTSALDLGDPGRDNLYGFGRLDALSALKAAGCELAKPKLEYASKIICGLQKDPEDMRLARGFYATAINIHNPNDAEVKFSKKLALTHPPKEQEAGQVIVIGEDVLKPDEALEVDCEDIKRTLFPKGFPAPYIKGFVVIRSSASLDVTAVYTAAKPRGFLSSRKVTSIDVEQIRERQLEEAPQVLPDLVPVPDPRPGINFCKLKEGKLVVTVKNQGSGSAGPTTTEVDFGRYGKFSMPTPALAPGASTDLVFEIPGGCYNPDCDFEITVDSMSAVMETNEVNNTGSGTCIG